MASKTPDGVVLEEPACPLGCASDATEVMTGEDRLHGLPGRFSVLRCSQCGLMRTSPRPTAETIGFYYPAEYGPHQPVSGLPPSKPIRYARALVEAVVDLRVTSLPTGLRPGRALEVGCGSGAFLARLAQLGWDVAGIEPSADAAGSAQRLGLSVHAGSLESAPLPGEKFDLVVGWMVIEHLHDPIRGLEQLRSWTKPGGWIALSVPDASSLDARLFGERWFALQLPTHLFHFTPDSIRLVLARAGWDVKRVMHQRTVANYFLSAQYVARDMHAPAWATRALERFPGRRGELNLLLYPIATALAALGQTGRMTVWARNDPHG